MRIRARLITKNYELEERRKKLGYSQQDFAVIVGIAINVFQRIEQIKQKPTEEQATSMALELKVSKDILFPEGYEKIVDIFNTQFERIADFTPPLLAYDEQRLLETADAKYVVNKMLKDLPERERHLLELRYGFKDDEPKTLDEVARNMGVTRERIRQIEAKAHERIRSKYKAEQL